VVLLILAVAAGGVFAQGNWSMGAMAEIGAYINFLDDDAIVDREGNSAAGVMGTAYHTPVGYDEMMAQYYLNYSLDGLRVGFEFNIGGGIDSFVDFSGDGYNFLAAIDLNRLLTGNRTSAANRLWGNYKLLNQMLHLEVAFISDDTNFWNSAETVGEVFGFDYYAINDDIGWGFASVDGDQYIVADFSFSGLNFGVMVPDVFPYGDKGNGRALTGGGWGSHWGMTAPPEWGPPPFRYNALVEDCLKKLIFGVKFDMAPIDVAVQFNLANYGAYIGANAKLGESVTASLSFEGTFDSTADQTEAGFAAGVVFDPGPFSAYLKGGVYMVNDDTDTPMVIGVRPGFSFNVIPSHLAITLDSGFWFQKDTDFVWAFVPQLWWNFKGDGAFNGYYSRYVAPNYDGQWTGMVVRFQMVKDVARALDVVFRFGVY